MNFKSNNQRKAAFARMNNRIRRAVHNISKENDLEFKEDKHRFDLMLKPEQTKVASFSKKGLMKAMMQFEEQ